MQAQFHNFKRIWLAEDDPDDCEIFREVLSELMPQAELTIFNDGEALIRQLSTSNKPDILFLDINIPRMTGLECLVEIRALRHFSRLPVVIFSNSRVDRQMQSAYAYGANLYFPKPYTIGGLEEGLKELFQMNWEDPFVITKNHYVNNTFVPFHAS
ncbi:MAG TPA: response regulator [Flavisolibacter sp.]|nr:response regulator [Flavisolibacter sp.]